MPRDDWLRRFRTAENELGELDPEFRPGQNTSGWTDDFLKGQTHALEVEVFKGQAAQGQLPELPARPAVLPPLDIEDFLEVDPDDDPPNLR